MVAPVCPSCGSLAVGPRCGSCGKPIKRDTTPMTAAPGGSADDAAGGVAIGGLSLDIGDSTMKSAAAPGLESGGPRHRKAAAYLSLQESEQAVLHAASRIFAAFIASGAVTEQNQNDYSNRAVQLAARMALVIEKYVQSDNEDW